MIFIDFLASKKVAIALFILLIFFSLAGVLVPQQSISSFRQIYNWQNEYPVFAIISDVLGLYSIFSSFVFVSTCTLLIVSISICNYRRIKHYAGTREILLGRWGSILFHLSFLIIFLGVILSNWTRFEGHFILTEGQIFKGIHDQYSNQKKSPLFYPEILEFQLQLQKFIPSVDYQKAYSHDQVRIIEADGKEVTSDIRKYHPLKYNGFTFYQNDHGFSPSFLVKSNDGNKMFHSFIAFRTLQIGKNLLFEDVFEIPTLGYTISGRLYPDAFEKDGKLVSRSIVPNNPLLKLTISRNDKNIYKGDVSLNQLIEFDNYSLSFDDLRYWSSFRVVRDYGIPIIYFGFLSAVIGLLMLLFLSQHKFKT